MSKAKAVLTEEELQVKRDRDKKYKQDQRARDKALSIKRENRKPEATYAAKTRENEKGIKDYLRDQGLQNAHVIDTVYDLSEQLNRPVFDLKLESSWGQELVEGEVIYRMDFEALRQISCPDVTESEFRDARYKSKSDHFFLANVALERPNTFCEQPHRAWVDEIFFKKTPSLKPNYSQADIKAWFNQQVEAAGGKYRSFLAASRQSQKSTAQIVEAIQFLLCDPDCRVMQISAVKDLTRKFTKFFRFYWTIDDIHNRTLFAKWFPEMMIYSDEKSDSNTFICPMAHLGLGPNMVATSADSSQTGARFCVGIFDDIADDQNEFNEEGRIKLVEKYDSINKLRAEYGVTITIGTPQNADQSIDTGDLYAVILARSMKNDHQYLRWRIDPAWTLKPEFDGVSPYEVTEERIEKLLFPQKLSFSFLMEELATSSEKSFRRQYLLEWTDAEVEEERLQFERPVLTSCTVQASVAPTEGPVYASADIGFNLDMRRDPTAITIFRVAKEKLWVLEQIHMRAKDSIKAETIVELTEKYKIRQWVIEQYLHYERLAEDIQILSAKKGITVRIFWDPVKPTKDRKFRALKSLETPIARGQIKFVFGLSGTSQAWIETLFEQMEKLDGTTKSRKSSSIHDDLTESLSLGCKFYIPDPVDDAAIETQKAAEEREAEDRRAAEYTRIYGVSWGSYAQATKPEPILEDPSDGLRDTPIYRALQKGGLTKQVQKTMSFKDMNRPHTNR